MKAGDINIKRFVRALHSALERLAGEAHCFGYQNDPCRIGSTSPEYSCRCGYCGLSGIAFRSGQESRGI